MTLLRQRPLRCFVVAAVALAACSDDGDSANEAPATSAVIAEAILNVGPEAQETTLGVGRRSVQVRFAAGALPRRQRVKVRALEPVQRGAVRPGGPTLQVATRNVSLARAGQIVQPLPAPRPGRRYVVGHVAEGSTMWVERGPTRMLGLAPAVAASDAGARDVATPDGTSAAVADEPSYLWEGDIAGSGEWIIVEVDAADAPVDAGAAADAGVEPGPADAGETPGNDAADGDAAAAVTQIVSLTPLRATANTAVTLDVAGLNLPQNWVVYVDNAIVPTTWLSQQSVRAQVPAAALTIPGKALVQVGAPNEPSLRSNPLYLTVDPAPGAPVVVGYSPDNGVPGALVSVIGSGLEEEGVILRDANGRQIAIAEVGSGTWLGATYPALQFLVPSDMPTGPLTVTNSRGSYRGQVFNVGQNLARIQGATAESSTQYNTSNWSRASGWDNNLQTSWFSANYDCATSPSCTSVPWFRINLPSAYAISRIAMRGNREYASGYDFVEGRFEIFGEADVLLWGATYVLPEPDRDLDIVLPNPIANARAVKFTSVRDQSLEPGFSELEVFGAASQ